MIGKGSMWDNDFEIKLIACMGYLMGVLMDGPGDGPAGWTGWMDGYLA